MSDTVTEESGEHKKWYAEAMAMTAERLPEFIRRLTQDYCHDYGTICHAIAAAACAAARAVEHSPSGGITGFQGSAVMWEFCRNWMQWDDTPRRLLDFRNLLYPQYETDFRTISQSIWTWTRAEAERNLSERGGTPEVRAHWQKIADGCVPFGFVVEES